MIKVCPKLAAVWPDLQIGYCSFEVNYNSYDRSPTPLDQAALSEQCDPSAPENIEATRRLFKACGADPSRYRPSCEALKRRLSSGGSLPSINPIVDVGNYLSIRFGVCVGSYDAAQLHGALSLGISDPDEEYGGIGGRAIKLKAIPVLRDDRGPFGSLYADSQRSCVTADTRSILMFFFHATASVSPNLILQQADALLSEFFPIHSYKCGVCI